MACSTQVVVSSTSRTWISTPGPLTTSLPCQPINQPHEDGHAELCNNWTGGGQSIPTPSSWPMMLPISKELESWNKSFQFITEIIQFGNGTESVWHSCHVCLVTDFSDLFMGQFGTDFAVNFLIYSHWPLLAIASCSWGGLSVQVMPVFLAGCFKFAKHLPQLWLCSS